MRVWPRTHGLAPFHRFTPVAARQGIPCGDSTAHGADAGGLSGSSLWDSDFAIRDSELIALGAVCGYRTSEASSARWERSPLTSSTWAARGWSRKRLTVELKPLDEPSTYGLSI